MRDAQRLKTCVGKIRIFAESREPDRYLMFKTVNADHALEKFFAVFSHLFVLLSFDGISISYISGFVKYFFVYEIIYYCVPGRIEIQELILNPGDRARIIYNNFFQKPIDKRAQMCYTLFRK